MKTRWRRITTLTLVTVGLACVGAWLALLWFEEDFNRPYAKVEEGLYIGSSVDRPPPGTQAVVNLCGRPDSYQVDAALWEPVLEAGKQPDLEWLRRVVTFIAKQRQAGRTTYVHCMAGVNRSGAAVTAYLMQAHGWGRDEALLYLRQKRPEVQPDSGLMPLLAEWEKTLAPMIPAAPPPAAPYRDD